MVSCLAYPFYVLQQLFRCELTIFNRIVGDRGLLSLLANVSLETTMQHRTFFLAVLFTVLTISPLKVFALSCAGSLPMLSQYRIGETIVDATVLRFVENEQELESHMEVHVERVFQGTLVQETLVVDSNPFDPLTSRFAVGARQVFGLIVSEDSDHYILGACSEVLSISDGLVAGYISDYECPDHRFWHDDSLEGSIQQVCSISNQTMSLSEFNLVQGAYFAGAQQAVAACVSSKLQACPERQAIFVQDTKALVLPSIVIRSGDNPENNEASLSNVILELLEAENGNFLFKLLNVEVAEPSQ
jgi:hypothetical protein